MFDAGGSLAEPAVTIDWGTAYELVLSLLVFGYEPTPSTFDVGPTWFQAIRQRASPALLLAHQELQPRDWLWLRLLVLVAARPDGNGASQVDEFLRRLRAIDPRRLYAHLLGANQTRAGPVTSSLVHKAVMGDRGARHTIGRVLSPQGVPEQGSIEHFLGLHAHRVKELLIDIATRWYTELFRAGESEVAAHLATEARTKRTIGQTSVHRLLPAAVVGFHYSPQRAIRRVLLVPSMICRPSVFTTRSGSTRLFFYPIADEPPEAEAQSAQLVRVHHALADRERLHILRALLRGQGTLSGISQELGLAVDRLGAQLVILRNARLITLHMDEQRTTYEIRKNLASMVYRTLQEFLPERSRAVAQRPA